jgi:hypothetical protein
MWKKNNKSYQKIRNFIEEVPVIETHEHYEGICHGNKEIDILQFIIRGCHQHDFMNADIGSEKMVQCITNSKELFDKRYAAFEKVYKKTCYTGYIKAFLEGFKICWGIKDLRKNSLLGLQGKIRKNRNQKFFNNLYKKYKIKAAIVNMTKWEYMRKIVDKGDRHCHEICRYVFPLLTYHRDINSKELLCRLEKYLKVNILTLNDYLEAFENYFKKSVKFGIVGIKDQSAYYRTINFKNIPQIKAEKIFDEIINHPRKVYSTEQVKDLDDFLFHRFMYIAAKYNMPVQIHTGHMAGSRNDIVKANPAHMTGVFDLHREVKFDLFHGSWPYMGELLFLGKNYPNVYIDLCWVHAIDPLYSVELLKRAIMTVAHTKILGFGGDAVWPEEQIGYLIQAKDNIAIALSDLIEMDWLNINDAKVIAKAILFNNPNNLFKLGFDKI